MHVGIVGAEGAKFTAAGEAAARALIRRLLQPGDVVVSGGCHLGGIDIWAEEEAAALGLPPPVVHRPTVLSWEQGYKPRNLLIVRDSEAVHCIAVDRLPRDFQGLRFPACYHCKTTDHVKSGGCWTVKKARAAGKPGLVHIVRNT